MRPNLIDIINGCCRCEEFDPGALMLTFAPACQTQYNLPSWINDIFFFFFNHLISFSQRRLEQYSNSNLEGDQRAFECADG